MKGVWSKHYEGDRMKGILNEEDTTEADTMRIVILKRQIYWKSLSIVENLNWVPRKYSYHSDNSDTGDALEHSETEGKKLDCNPN